MTKFSYLLAAAAAIAIVTPSFAQDAPKAGVTINQGAAPTGEVKRDEGKPQEGRGEMRKEGDRGHGRMEVRGDRRDGDRGEMRVERREMRSGVRVELGDRDRGEITPRPACLLMVKKRIKHLPSGPHLQRTGELRRPR